jgi:hypothetical protein
MITEIICEFIKLFPWGFLKEKTPFSGVLKHKKSPRMGSKNWPLTKKVPKNASLVNGVLSIIAYLLYFKGEKVS